jgi:acyl-CoA reductase-like NAD-dependent aldehyde dehydrogenase
MTDQTFSMLVNGKLVTTDTTFGVINPSTGKVFAQAPDCDVDTLESAIAGCKSAFQSWRLTSMDERKKTMTAAVEKIRSARANLGDVLTKEQGKPLPMALWEIDRCCDFLLAFTNIDIEDKVLVDNETETVIEKRVPIGVVGGITPWNFPPLMAAWKIAEAVMTGNTIIIKPSPYTPLSTLLLGEAFVDTFPPGVINIVSGGDLLGRRITESNDIAKISFTGSTRTGKAIQSSTSSTLKRLTLELGGNDAAIVLPGSSVKDVAPKIFEGAMRNSGQVCMCIKRCYVHESIHDEFVQELAACAGNAKVGDGFEDGIQYGPVNNKMQFDRVSELVEDAKTAGATINAGGAPMPGDGYFYPPTIVSGLKEGVRLVDEEQFGPALPVISYSDEADVVDRANGTSYGLGGSVWGPSEKAAEIAAMLDAGTVWVNSHGKISPDVPFGGMKESGVGRQFASGTVEGHTESKILRIPK